MPNRLIKESIKRSPEIDCLSWFEEVVFYRLIVTADDYGRLDGRPIVLRNDLFPTKETVTRKSIEDALAKLVSVGLLVPYVDAESNMPYYYFPSWHNHQRIRDSKEKYPAPTDDAISRGNSRQFAAKCGLESESKSESEYESNPNEANASCAEPPASGHSTPTQSAFDIPLADGTMYNVPMENIDVYRKLYPAVDIEQALRNMIGWCMSHERERKTRRGIKAFITSWLTRDQDKAKFTRPVSAAPVMSANEKARGFLALAEKYRQEEEGQS